MKVYLASAWSRREEMQEVAANLEAMGHVVTSRWITNENDSSTLAPLNSSYNAAAQANADREARHTINAKHDFEDVISADAIIRFSDAEEMQFPLASAKLVSGARHFEFGVAYTWDAFARVLEGFGIKLDRKLLFVVGGKQNIFDRLPEVMHITDKEQMYDVMMRAAWIELEDYYV